MNRDIHVLGLSSRELHPNNQVLVLLDHVYRRGPSGVPCPLLALSSPGYATEHLVEQAVHLAQRIVEPAAPISAHHILYPFSRVRPACRGGTHIDPAFTFFARLCPTSFPYQISQGPCDRRYSTCRGVCIPGALRSRKASTSSSTP